MKIAGAASSVELCGLSGDFTCPHHARLLFISDLHLEMHENSSLIAYLWRVYEEGARIHYLGDIYGPPVEYNRFHLPPGLYLAGNHDTSGPRVSLCGHFRLSRHVLLLHGHQAERHYRWAVYPCWNRLRGVWRRRRCRHWEIAGQPRMKRAEAFGRKVKLSRRERRRAAGLAQWVRTEFGEDVRLVVMGHLHRAFNSDNAMGGLLPGLTLLNCGRGWLGEHITREADGAYYFRWFEQVRRTA
jgi:predicted phosphodiesterase